MTQAVWRPTLRDIGLERLYQPELTWSGVKALITSFWLIPLWGLSGTSLLLSALTGAWALFGLLALSSPRQALPEPRPDSLPHPTLRLRSMLLLSAIPGFYLCALQLLGAQYRRLIVDATAYVEGTMMFVIANRFKVNAGYEDMFEELFRHQAHLVEGMPGFFKWELHRREYHPPRAATGRAPEAQALLGHLHEQIRFLTGESMESRPRVLLLFGTPRSFLAMSEETYAGDLLRLVGGQNVASQFIPHRTGGGFHPLSLELIVRSRPEWILVITHGDPERVAAAYRKELEGNPAWWQLPAVSLGQVHVLPDDLFATAPGPRLDQALAHAPALHPAGEVAARGSQSLSLPGSPRSRVDF